MRGSTAAGLTVWALLLAPLAARAEAPWMTSRGRVAPEQRLEVFGGNRSLGLSALLPDDTVDARAAWGGELVWSWLDQVAELRGGRVWQLTAPRFATASAMAGVAAFVIPGRTFDAGLGPHAGLTLSLGGPRFSVDLGLQTGVEAFFFGPPRLPQRALLGATTHLGPVSVAVMARTGVDLVPGQQFVFRGEVMLSVGWLRAPPQVSRSSTNGRAAGAAAPSR